MTTFTRVGANIWNWEPWIALDNPAAQMLWFALYTTAEAKRVIPGLWHGSIAAMADAQHRPADETMKSLDHLLDHEMVEFDPKHRVLRMTKLPDAGEYPTSPTILESWWSRFSLVPPCQVRDAHVSTVRWILDRGAADAKKNRSKKPTALHEEIWSTTFGTVPIPSPRRRGMRRLLDADTGTEVQPSLFRSPSEGLYLPSPEPLRPPSGAPSSFLSENKDLRYFDSLSRGYGEGEGVGVGSGVGGVREPTMHGPHDPTLSAPDHAAIENANRPRPALALVPAFTPEQLLTAIATAGGLTTRQVVRETLRESLHATIRYLDDRGWGIEEARMAGRWLATAAGRAMLQQIPPSCPPDERVCVWAASPAGIVRAIQLARELADEASERSAILAEVMGKVH